MHYTNQKNQIHNLHILQWNCFGAASKLDEIKRISNEQDIIFLSETWLKEDKTLVLPNFNIIRRDRKNELSTNKGGGVCICIKKNIPYKIEKDVYSKNKKLETVAISINIDNNEPFLLVAVYRVPDCIPTTTEEWTLLLNAANNFKYFLFGGDFNAHNIVWGSNKDCLNGNNFLKAINESNNDFAILNDGTHTYSKYKANTYSSSAIDLTVSSSNLITSTSWEVLSDKMNSDHFPISIKIKLKLKKIPISSTHRINT